MKIVRLIGMALLVIPAVGPAADEQTLKLPPGVKLPPQPRAWLAPSVDMTPPPAGARWGTTWERGRALPLPLAGHNAIGSGRFLYVLGGVSGREELGQRNVWMSKISRDGALGRWKKTTPFPNPVAFAEAVLAGGRIYLIGGSSRVGMLNIYTQVMDG